MSSTIGRDWGRTLWASGRKEKFYSVNRFVEKARSGASCFVALRPVQGKYRTLAPLRKWCAVFQAVPRNGSRVLSLWRCAVRAPVIGQLVADSCVRARQARGGFHRRDSTSGEPNNLHTLASPTQSTVF